MRSISKGGIAMVVEELIEILKNFPKGTEVYGYSYDYDFGYETFKIENVEIDEDGDLALSATKLDY
jgi:hypothetical protein